MGMQAVPGVAETVARTTSGQATATEVVTTCLETIHRRDPAVNAFIQVLAEEALAEARALDEALRAGRPPGPLHGVPVAVKDEFDVAGSVTTYGGHSNSRPAAQDAAVVRRLRAAGAVIVGKTTLSEFGSFPYAESVAYGVTRNPWDPQHTPGGSSGGSAVAVATGMVPLALGADAGGSIRIPAAYCGVFGLKPQRGRVTHAPREHLWYSLGHVGFLTRSVLDSAIAYDAVRGSLPLDRYRAGDAGSFVDAAGLPPSRLRIGWAKRPVTHGVRLDKENLRALRETVALLSDLGHEVVQVEPEYREPTFTFLPQFLGGIRHQCEHEIQHFDRLEKRTRELYRTGAWVTPAVVRQSLQQGEHLSLMVNRVFDVVDVLLTPPTAHRPPRIGVLDGTGPVRAARRSMQALAYTALWNVAGNPAAAVPCGLGTDGMPLAVQLVGPRDGEERLLSLAAQIERARPWPTVAPEHR